MTDPPTVKAPAVQDPAHRSVVLVHHATRPGALEVAEQVREGLAANGVAVRSMMPVLDTAGATPHEGAETDVGEAELVVVLGGDGSILSAAELARPHRVPVLGVNLGHVGFLAEAEEGELSDVVRRIVERDYAIEERMTLDLVVTTPDGDVAHGWALNEAAVEKAVNGRTIDAAIGVDERGLSTFKCDGIILATPTGSTAYAFSGGGPVVWPGVEALLLVPIAAHALFTRPLVVGPESVLEVEMLGSGRTAAVIHCDGRRSIDAPPGSRIEARRGEIPVLLARLYDAPFSGRLVAKFDLPVGGWRGRGGGA